MGVVQCQLSHANMTHLKLEMIMWQFNGLGHIHATPDKVMLAHIRWDHSEHFTHHNILFCLMQEFWPMFMVSFQVRVSKFGFFQERVSKFGLSNSCPNAPSALFRCCHSRSLHVEIAYLGSNLSVIISKSRWISDVGCTDKDLYEFTCLWLHSTIETCAQCLERFGLSCSL